jgi:hydrogenase maturation protein HypF
LEAAAADGGVGVPLPLALNAGGEWVGDWEPLLEAMLDQGVPVPQRAADFHEILGQTILAVAEKVRESDGIDRVGLSGGVFQNKRLAERAAALLGERGFDVGLSHNIPANDAGLSYGQIIEAGSLGVQGLVKPRLKTLNTLGKTEKAGFPPPGSISMRHVRCHTHLL